MRLRHSFVPLVVVTTALSIPGAAAATKKKHHKPKHQPLQQQIHQAVLKAEQSPLLWATINCCGSCGVKPPTDSVVAVRGEMPALDVVASTLLMTLSVQSWNSSTNTFVPINDVRTIDLHKHTHLAYQGGVTFPLSLPPSATPYLVRASITFTWKVGSKIVGKVTRNTGHGYKHVDRGNPPGTSLGTCSLTGAATAA